ncbi:glycosyltransferase [Sinanaerobacter sp. ZZT-01]|uniref:glycosyltransferase n=1 Tax=Sinanaerobacter sp. ZZT-01 TaxID=3111540 RepID=UPI002D772839|nr:glycosyltransferase [Sinanaerobacter sp. ZZT-01]WRR93007.1 glycosyltransferase [Sinanaerobacter sp. ZZT-01]
MKDLSIVILYQKSDLLPCIELLKPIIKKFDTELIVINNNEIEESIPYKYDLVKFDQNYKYFKEFCISSCLGKRIMLIDSGILLSEAFINFITKQLETNTYFNISCTVKSFLSPNKKDVFLHDEVILYNRGITGFNHHYTEASILDIGFINPELPIIDLYINKFIENKAFQELFIWFSNYIVNLTQEEQAYCYSKLEKIKAEIQEIDWHALESLFTDSDSTNNYSRFLSCKNAYLTKSMSTSKILKKIKEIKVSPDETYFSWLLKDFILQKRDSLSLLRNLPEAVMKNLIFYLLENDANAWNYLNTFISDMTLYLTEIQKKSASTKSINKVSKKEIAAYTKLILICLEYMDQHADNQNEKDLRMNIFTFYTAFGENLVQLNQFPKDSEIIDLKMEKKLITTITEIRHTDTAHVIEKLSALCEKIVNKNNILRHYIQILRFTRQHYNKILSICMIVKDEEKNLSRCLSSVSPLIDCGLAELIIIDTGSVDRTIEIAREYTDKVYLQKWEGNFSKARNQSLIHSDAEYVFIMDADEEFRPSDLSALQTMFSTPDYKQFSTFTLNIISYTDTKLQNYAVMAQPRIFKNDSTFHYSSAVHNQPVFKGPIKNSDVSILHYGYIMTPDIKEKKYQRTSTLLKKELQRDPRSIYFRFQLCNSYAMYGDLKNALHQVEIYMRLISEEAELHDNVLMYYNNAAAIYINCYLYEKSEEVCNTALSIEPDFIDFVYYKGFIRFEQEDYETALTYFSRYLTLITHYNQMKTKDDGRFAFYTVCNSEDVKKMLLQTHYRLHEYDACIKDMEQILSETVRINCIYEFMNACLITNNTSALTDFYASNANGTTKELFEKTFRYFEDVLQNEAPKNNFYTLSEYTWDALDFESFWPFLYEVLLELLKLDAKKIEEDSALILYKKLLQLVLHRTEKLLYDYLSEEELVDLYNKYMIICSKLASGGKVHLLEARERIFIKRIVDAYQATDASEMLSLLQNSFLEYHKMKGIVDLSIHILFPSSSAETTDTSPHTEEQSSTNRIENKVNELLVKINKDISQLENRSADTSENIAQNMSAVKLMIKELENYRTLIPVQIYLCRLYSLTKQYQKVTESYCRLKLNYPLEASIQIKDLIPQSLLKSNQEDLKILHGTMDDTNNTMQIVRMLKNNGVDAKALNYIPKHSECTSDYEMDINSLENGAMILERTIDTAAKLIPQYDIFHFHHSSSLHFKQHDLAIIKDLNKKLVVEYCAENVRTSEKAAQLSPYVQLSSEKDLEIFRKLEVFSKYASCCIAQDYEVYEYVKDFFDDIHIISPFVRMPTLSEISRPSKTSHKFIISHCAENSHTAGTSHILKVMEELKYQYQFDFKLIKKAPLEQVQTVYQSSDLIIGELYGGTYSRYVIGAMASGKPVMGYISDFMKEKYPKELPLIPTSPESFKSDLEKILKNKDMLNEIGKAGPAFVHKYHNADIEIAKLIKLYHHLSAK